MVRPLLCALVFCHAAPALAPAAEVIARGPAREPKPFKYEPKSLAALPKPFLEEFPAVTLYSGTSHVIEPDGTIETTTHEITRLNGRKGIEQYGEYRSISYDPSYQKLVLNEARVLKKDGRIVPVQNRHLQLRDVGTDYQVYDAEKQLVISFPNLEVGDCYEVKWTVRGKNPEFAGHFFSRYTFGDDAVPVALDEVHVVLPKGKAFHWGTSNGKVEPVIRALKDGGKHYHWHTRDRLPLPKEEDKPSREALSVRLACSTFPDWQAVADWKEKLRKDCWECAEDVRKTVREVTKGKTTAEEKAKALTYWVRQNIRYLSRGPAGTGYTPHKPGQVLGNLFGDCKDQAQLLAVMLREIGLDPHLVTLGVLDDGQVMEDVPCPWGTHAILMVPIDAKEHWIDTTVSMAPWDWLPRSDRDRLAYLTRRGAIELKRTPAYTLADNRVEQSTIVSVQGDGTSICRRSMFYHGGVALGRREAWIEATPGERRRYLNNELQDAYPKSRIESIDIPDSSLRAWEKPVQAQMTFVIPRHFLGETTREASVTDSQVYGRILGFNLDAERRLPLNLGSPFESLHLYVVNLPPAFRFDGLPREQEIESAWGSFRLQVKTDAKNPRRVELVMHTKLKEVTVGPEAFAKFQKFQEDLQKAYRVWLNIKPTTETDDIPLLETLLALAPGADSFAARTLARLYLDSDKADEARRVLDQATLYHPDDATLWDMRLKAARDLSDTEALNEKLVRYFPAETKHALALAHTRVRRSDFAGARAILAPLTRSDARDVRAQAYLEMARLCMKQGLTGPALLSFEAAWQTDQVAVASGDALFFAGTIHEKRDDIVEAIKAFQLAHKLEPDNADTLTKLIRLEVKAGKSAAALDHLRRLVLAADGNVTRLTQAAEIYYELGRFEDAFEMAERARETGYQGRVQRVLGLLYLQKGDHEKAIFHLERGDVDAAVLQGLIEAHAWRGELAEAYRNVDAVGRLSVVPAALKEWVEELRGLAKEYKRVLALRPDTATMPASPQMQRAVNFYLCADLALRKKQPRELVEALLDKAFAEKAPVAPAYGLRALVALEQGQLRKASADLEQAFRLGADARAFCVRGRLRLERGEKGAIDDLLQAAKLTEHQDAKVLHWLAAALQQAGKIDEALALQKRAAELRPGDPEISAQLSMLQAAKRP